jgi:glycosyltransferase involved in cell wall biosynthesis
MPTIAYIAPELTAVPETFVFQEVVALENRGFRVLTFALREAAYPAREAQDLARRTVVLGQGPGWRRLADGVRAALCLGPRARATLGTLWGDMRRVGLADARSWGLVPQWLAAARVAKDLLAARASHIHAHFVDAPAQVAMYAAAMSGIPFTCTAHAGDLFRHGLLLQEKAQRARKLLTISHFNRRWLERKGVDPSRIEVVRCAPDILSPAAGSARPRNGAYRIGTLCSLVERKGVDDLLRATALLLRRRVAPVRLVIAGDGPERLRLQVLAEQLRIERHVDFVGAVARPAVAQWLRSLDLFVTACKADRRGETDGIPVALMEAMSLGVPVVSTRICGVPELVVDGQTGYLAQPADPQSLAGCIEEAMAQPQRARALGRAARAHVRWEFGREANLRRLVRHFADRPAPSTRPVPLEQAA